MNAEHELPPELEALHTAAFGWSVHCCGGDAHKGEDVLQNAYLKLLRGSAIFRGQASFKTWWFGVIRFTALEEHRRLRFRESLAGKLLKNFFGEASSESQLHPAPWQQVELDERAAHLHDCLSRLPARQSEVLHLVFYQGLTLVDSAKVMGISTGSAAQHYERGKTKLRSLFEASPTP